VARFKVSGNESYISSVSSYLYDLKSSRPFLALLKGLASSGSPTRIFSTGYSSVTTERGWTESWKGATIAFNNSNADYPIEYQNKAGTFYQRSASAKYTLAHELVHAWAQTNYWSSPVPFQKNKNLGDSFRDVRAAEVAAVRYTNNIMLLDGAGYVRTTFGVIGKSSRIDTYEDVRSRVYGKKK
jgi:hypothetical protein